MNRQIIVIGGGLAGLISAILLQKKGFTVLLVEKKKYPFHRVCGEYISNEVVPFLKKNDLYPEQLTLPTFDTFKLTSTNGNIANLKLDLGGFGISRYSLDYFLYQKALSCGVEVLHNTVVNLSFDNDSFQVSLNDGSYYNAPLVIGAYGKRTKLDKDLNRGFINKRSPYIGVKYHVRIDKQESDTVTLHNFKGGYCGINKIEDNKFNLCYLSQRNNLKHFGSIPEMEINVLHKNPHLKRIFNDAEFLFDKPEVINEISFETKKLVENHILMCGDSAGMITPLCGNGMAIAIHAAKLLTECIGDNYENEDLNRTALETAYSRKWNEQFKNRLWAGRQIQRLFGSGVFSNVAVGTANNSKLIANYLVSKTHGKTF